MTLIARSVKFLIYTVAFATVAAPVLVRIGVPWWGQMLTGIAFAELYKRNERRLPWFG